MANNQYVNKVIYGGTTLIDISDTTATAAKVLASEKFYLKSGAAATGECTYDADTSDATADASEILYGETAYVNGNKITGQMPNNGGANVVVSSTSGTTIPLGYSDGSAKAVIDSTSLAALVDTNIKNGVTILGVTGVYSGQSVTATSVNITPSTSAQTIMPPTGYDYISQANVSAISYVETDNAAGGKTVTIAGV